MNMFFFMNLSVIHMEKKYCVDQTTHDKEDGNTETKLWKLKDDKGMFKNENIPIKTARTF